MTNDALYNHFLSAEIPSAIAALAADAISAKVDELWLGQPSAVGELANDFIKLYGISGDSALSELKARLV